MCYKGTRNACAPKPGAKVKPTDTDTICIIIKNHFRSVVEYCVGFRNNHKEIAPSSITTGKAIHNTKSIQLKQ